MARISTLDLDKAEPKAKEILDGVNKALGTVPNVFKTFAHSPAVLEAYMGFSGAMAKAKLPATVREQIALTVAGKNECDYCASAHTVLGKKAGLDEKEIPLNLDGKATDAKSQAVLDFTLKVVEKRGQVSDADVKAIKEAGFSETEVVEMVNVIALNIFTNYFNHVADTEIDFPVVKTKKALV